MDYKKILDNKIFKVTALIVLPTALVGGYYAFKYLNDKRKKRKFVEAVRERYKDVINVDEFIEAVKYVSQPIQYGYDFEKFQEKKDELSKLDFKEVSDFYQIAKKTLKEQTKEENDKVLKFLQNIFKQ